MEDGIIAVVVLLIAIGLCFGISVKSIPTTSVKLNKRLIEVLESVRNK